VAKKDIVVIGASAGGMEALQKLVSRFPAGLQASVFIVWHLSPGAKTILPSVLSKAGPLPAAQPEDGDRIEPGRIYVAPNDHHMLLERGYIRVARGPKENRFRPAIDPLFRSAAYIYGPRVVGVVMTGALDDGTAGLWTIKLRGGTAIVQDPAEALIRSMPLSALDNVSVDHRLTAAEIGELIARLAREEAPAPLRVPAGEDEKTLHEVRIAKEREALEEDVLKFGELSPFTCPECHGVLTMLREGRIIRFRCHTGHAFSADTLLTRTARSSRRDCGTRCAPPTRRVEAHERLRPVREAAIDSEELDVARLREKA
jgi:two-component system chemotaxis response regulator CheB